MAFRLIRPTRIHTSPIGLPPDRRTPMGRNAKKPSFVPAGDGRSR